ncbi:unnamed protein product [Polarella glacialis]|uniref:Uncharacterized protein n=1 Tax=Polarella glacialis TaxID=89957 RepID=A0A813J209_POLGL|nr:unnamed protein product [Polarella glacialis]
MDLKGAAAFPWQEWLSQPLGLEPSVQRERDELSRRLEERCRHAAEREAQWQQRVQQDRLAMDLSEDLPLARLLQQDVQESSRLEMCFAQQQIQAAAAKRRFAQGQEESWKQEARGWGTGLAARERESQRAAEERLAELRLRQVAAEEAGRIRWMETAVRSINSGCVSRVGVASECPEQPMVPFEGRPG